MGLKYAFGLCILSSITASNARRLQLKHEVVDIKRQAAPVAVPATTTSQNGLATIFPSPDASPVTVTEQSQLVPSFVPQFTLCELPPIAFISFTPTTTVGSLPYLNYSASIPTGSGTCTTIYKPTVTMVCATVLSDLTTSYTISHCSQDITFSTEYGYKLVTPSPTLASVTDTISPGSLSLITPPPELQSLTTYFIAPWQELTSAGPPADVDYKICTGFANGTEKCVSEYWQWKTSLLTLTSTTTTLINITTSIPGPSQLIVETFVANVTGTATAFSMSTTMELETSTLSETTVASSRAAQSTGPTVYQTQTIEYASRITSTVRVVMTRTTTAGTATITISQPDSSTSSQATDASDVVTFF